MKLKDLEKIIRGLHSCILTWKNSKGKWVETFCKISTIKYCDKKILEAEVLKFDIDYQVIRITLQMGEK